LSSSFSSFTIQFSSVYIPKGAQDALQVAGWREVVLEKMKTLEKNKTWSGMTLQMAIKSWDANGCLL